MLAASIHFLAGLVALAASVTAAAAQYEVQRIPGSQDLAVSLRLPAGGQEPVKLAPRGMAWGLKPQVDDVRCGGQPLPRDADGHWVAAASCTAVVWRVVPDRVPAEGADASEQRSLAIGQEPWFLLAEPTSLLRPQNTADAATLRAAPGSLRLAGATPVPPDAFRVPPVNSAPEFYLIGAVSPSRRTVGQFQVSYIADDAARVQELGLEALHATALHHLLQVVPLPPSTTAADRSLFVFWLGVAESRGQAGGAAGSRSFVANYVVGGSANQARNRALTMMIMAHEQFHQLVDLARSGLSSPPFAVWLNESLAQYHGLKALVAADKSPAAQQVWAQFVDLQRPVAHGLLELNRRHEAGDPSVYDLFYSQGATLWHALDLAITAQSQGKLSLNDLVAGLLGSPAAADGSWPGPFIDQLRSAGGAAVDQILSKYVGK